MYPLPCSSRRNAISAAQPGPAPARNRWSLLAGVAVAAVSLAAAIPSADAATTYLLDFGGAGSITVSPDSNGNYWNNVTETVASTNDGVLANLVSSTNGASLIGLQMVSRFNGVNPNGTTNPASLAATGYPATATGDSFYGNTGEFNGLTNIFPAFKLVNLDPSEIYSFTFYASRTGVTDIRTTDYSVVGANNGLATLDVSNNEITKVSVNGILPTPAGEITISLTPSASNNNGATRFTYLGVLEVVAVPEPATGVFLLAGAAFAAGRRRRSAGC